MSVELIYTIFLLLLAIPALILLIALCVPDKPEHKEKHNSPTNSGSHAGVLSSQMTRLSNFKI